MSTRLDKAWASRLGEEFPESAAQLDALIAYLRVKEEKLASLLRFCAAHPRLPMRWMYEEYSTALDAVERETAHEVKPETTAMSPQQKGAYTRRLRTRTALCDTAAQLIAQNPFGWKVEEVASQAGVSIVTLYNHFLSRKGLIVAAYEQLISKSELYDLPV